MHIQSSKPHTRSRGATVAGMCNLTTSSKIKSKNWVFKRNWTTTPVSVKSSWKLKSTRIKRRGRKKWELKLSQSLGSHITETLEMMTFLVPPPVNVSLWKARFRTVTQCMESSKLGKSEFSLEIRSKVTRKSSYREWTWIDPFWGERSLNSWC